MLYMVILKAFHLVQLIHLSATSVCKKIHQKKVKAEEKVNLLHKVKVGVLRPVQQPGSYWDRSSELPLVGLEPTEVTAYD